MTKTDRKALKRYVRHVADQVGLRDWVFKVAKEPCEDGSDAHVSIPYGRKFCTINVAAGFRSESPSNQRDTIVHELVHCHFESMASMVQNDLEKIMGRPADAVFYCGFTRQYEYGIDAMAGALSPHMPLICWPERNGK